MIYTQQEMRKHIQNLLTIIREERTVGRFTYASGSGHDIEIRAAQRCVIDTTTSVKEAEQRVSAT